MACPQEEVWPSVTQSISNFWQTHPKDEVWPGGTQPMLLPESHVCMPSLWSLGPRVYPRYIPFLVSHALRKRFGRLTI